MSRLRLFARIVGVLLYLLGPGARLPAQRQGQPAKPRIAGSVVPGKDWQTATPESLGYSTRELEALRAWVSTQQTGSMMVIAQCRVLFSYGDVTHTSKIASVRKSVLGMLYGAESMNGHGKDTVDDSILNKTVVELGLQDKTPFLPIERNATLIQLLASRSGIYIVNHDDPQAASSYIAMLSMIRNAHCGDTCDQ